MRKESYMKHELTMAEIAKFQKEYKKEPQNRVAELAVGFVVLFYILFETWQFLPL